MNQSRRHGSLFLANLKGQGHPLSCWKVPSWESYQSLCSFLAKGRRLDTIHQRSSTARVVTLPASQPEHQDVNRTRPVGDGTLVVMSLAHQLRKWPANFKQRGVPITDHGGARWPPICMFDPLSGAYRGIDCRSDMWVTLYGSVVCF